MADICEFFHRNGRCGLGESVAEAIYGTVGNSINWESLSLRNVIVKEEPVLEEPGNWNSWEEGDVFVGEEKIGTFRIT